MSVGVLHSQSKRRLQTTLLAPYISNPPITTAIVAAQVK